MKAEHHQRRLARWLRKMNRELTVMRAEKHFQRAGYKSISAVNADIEEAIREVNITELLKGE